MENVLNLAGWTILDTKETDQGYQFVAVYAIEALCVYCHSSDMQRFGKKEQLFLDLGRCESCSDHHPWAGRVHLWTQRGRA